MDAFSVNDARMFDITDKNLKSNQLSSDWLSDDEFDGINNQFWKFIMNNNDNFDGMNDFDRPHI